MRFLGGVQARGAAWRGLCTMVGAWSVRGFAMFSVIERDTGRWVGRIGPWQPEGWPGREVAWGVAREFAGRGYAYEAACAVMDYAVDVLGWDHVIHTIDPENMGSIRLAQRLGCGKRGAGEPARPAGDIPRRRLGPERRPVARPAESTLRMTDMPPTRFRVVERGRRLE